MLVASCLYVAWQAPAAAGAVGAAALLAFFVFAEWAVRGNPEILVVPGGPLPGIGPNATDGSVSLHLITAAIFAAGQHPCAVMYYIVHNWSTAMQAIQIEAFGNPSEVLKVVDVPDAGPPAAGEVVIALEASPINMSDLLMISGRYGYRPKLPSIVGAEGVGRVVAVGAGVTHLEEGDRTLVPFPSPATVNVVRREELIDELKAIGGDVVLVDGSDIAKRVAAETGHAAIALAIDGVSDTATANLLACLAPRACWCSTAASAASRLLPIAALHFPRRRHPRLLARQLVQRSHGGESRGDV